MRKGSKNNSAAEIAKVLLSIEKLVILSHHDPDSDAYGSMCALALALEKLGKDVICVNQNGYSEQYAFIPGASKVQAELPSDDTYSHVVVCDCGDIKRVGDFLLEPLQKSKKPIINLDHHASNDGFGEYNLVKEKASSTSEVVLEILEAMSCEISPEIASCLFIGIAADTGSFRYSNVSADTFLIAGKLVACGADPHQIALNLFSNVPLSTVKLQAQALRDLQLHFNERVAEVVITEEMYKSCKASSSDTDLLVEKIRDIKGVLVAVFIRWHDGLWKVSLRSKDDRLDVSKVAAYFGGGGHRAAAAFRWRKGVSEIRKLLMEQIEQLLKEEKL